MTHELCFDAIPAADLITATGGQNRGDRPEQDCNLPKSGETPSLRQQAGQLAAQHTLVASDDPVFVLGQYCRAANNAGLGFDFANKHQPQ